MRISDWSSDVCSSDLEQSFTVGPDVAWVSVRATIDANTLALVLIDPDGNRYGSAIALPVLGDTVTTGAPAKPGVWRVTVRGIGSVSGTGVDPLGVTNGYAAPGTVTGAVRFLNSRSAEHTAEIP